MVTPVPSRGDMMCTGSLVVHARQEASDGAVARGPPAHDLIIAATAEARDRPVVSTDGRGFALDRLGEDAHATPALGVQVVGEVPDLRSAPASSTITASSA